jgi:hypothetical protein
MFVFICVEFVLKVLNEHRGEGKVRRGETAFLTRLLRVEIE